MWQQHPFYFLFVVAATTTVAFAGSLTKMKVITPAPPTAPTPPASRDHINYKLSPRAQHSNFTGPSDLHFFVGKCFPIDIGNYEWRVCPFDNVTQHELNNNWNSFNGILGVWTSYLIKNGKFAGLIFEDGDDCGSIQRQATVIFVCGKINHTMTATEPEGCKYELEFQTPLACGNALAIRSFVNDEVGCKLDDIDDELVNDELTAKGHELRTKTVLKEAGLLPRDRAELAAAAAAAAAAAPATTEIDTHAPETTELSTSESTTIRPYWIESEKLGECEDELNRSKELVKQLEEELQVLRKFHAMHADGASEPHQSDDSTLKKGASEDVVQEAEGNPGLRVSHGSEFTEKSVAEMLSAEKASHRHRRSHDPAAHHADALIDPAEIEHDRQAEAVTSETESSTGAHTHAHTSGEKRHRHKTHLQQAELEHHGNSVTGNNEDGVHNAVHRRAHVNVKDVGGKGAAPSIHANSNGGQTDTHRQHHQAEARHAMPAQKSQAHGDTDRVPHTKRSSTAEVSENAHAHGTRQDNRDKAHVAHQSAVHAKPSAHDMGHPAAADPSHTDSHTDGHVRSHKRVRIKGPRKVTRSPASAKLYEQGVPPAHHAARDAAPAVPPHGGQPPAPEDHARTPQHASATEDTSPRPAHGS
eukprot:m.532231 g.532231  ORF g.532231 m.532231 type:complete len:643 (-) comp22042_c1_seq2:191-2119(-)